MSSALPSPAWRRKSRRRRAPITDTVIPPCDYDSSWSDKKCDYDFSWSDKKSYRGESSCLNKKSDCVHRDCSCSARSDSMDPLGLCSARSCDPTVPLSLCSTRSLPMVTLDHDKKLTAKPTCELSREEARVKVRETIAMVNRCHGSDDWRAWTPPTVEDEVRRLDDPDALRLEIIANEEKYRQQLQTTTTAHCRASALSGRDTLEPSQIAKTAVATLDFCLSGSDDTRRPLWVHC